MSNCELSCRVEEKKICFKNIDSIRILIDNQELYELITQVNVCFTCDVDSRI